MSSCPSCHRPLPEGSPRGLCPYCLLAEDSMDGEATRDQAVSGFIPPRLFELQKHFDRESIEILGLIGRGGMGAVYRARQPRLNRDVAIKVLPPEFSSQVGFDERFSREAQVLAKLDHPNIVDVYDFGKAGPYRYLIMEFVDGANLREMLADGQIEPAEALQIVPQICAALQFAHDAGIVHRDVKPENILIDVHGQVKITDFGIAKLASDSPDVHLTATQQVMGTLHYMAPEQIECTRDVDHRADIFALGVVFYEMLTGELPLGRFDPPSVKLGTGRKLDQVVMRTLEKDPNRRYAHASDLGHEVDRVAAERFDGPKGHGPRVIEFLRAPLLTIEHSLGTHRLAVLLTLTSYCIIVLGAILCLLVRPDEELIVTCLATLAIYFAVAIWGTTVCERTEMGALLEFYARPLQMIARPWKTPKRSGINTYIQWIRDYPGNIAIIYVIIGWALLLASIASFYVFAVANDDYFLAIPFFAALALAAGRAALPPKSKPLTTADKWIIYPLLLAPLLTLTLMLSVGPGFVAFVVCYESRFLRQMDGPPQLVLQRVLLSVYVATVVQCAWWSVLCFLAGRFPKAVRLLFHPWVQHFESQTAHTVGLIVFVAGAGLATLGMLFLG